MTRPFRAAKQREARGPPVPRPLLSALADQPTEIRTPAIRISITHKITRYPSANFARRSAVSAKPSLDRPRPDIRSMVGTRCSRWKPFSIAQQQQARLGGRVALVWTWGDRGSVYRSVPVPAPQYVHLYRSPKQRFRRCIWVALACLGVAGVGAAMMVPLSPRNSDAAVAPADQVSRAEG